MKQWIREHERHEGNQHSPTLLTSYLDGGIVIGEPWLLKKVLDYSQSDKVVSHGLHLRLDKCNIWWPTAPQQKDKDVYSTCVRIIDEPVRKVLKEPIGNHDTMAEAFTHSAKTQKDLIRQITKLGDSQVVFTLLKQCFGLRRIMYHLGTIKPGATRQGAGLFYSYVHDGLTGLIGIPIPVETSREFQLPVRPTNPKVPTFGLGLTSAADVGPQQLSWNRFRWVNQSELNSIRTRLNWFYLKLGLATKPSPCSPEDQRLNQSRHIRPSIRCQSLRKQSRWTSMHTRLDK